MFGSTTERSTYLNEVSLECHSSHSPVLGCFFKMWTNMSLFLVARTLDVVIAAVRNVELTYMIPHSVLL